MIFNIALVEDDEKTAETVKKYIEQVSDETGIEFSVKWFRDGDEITYEYSANYDIIFLDIQMKRLDGMSAAEYIRSKDENVIIIFMTNMTSYAIRGYTVNALDYLIKPVPYFAFLQQLKKAVELAKSRKTSCILVSDIDGTHKIEKASITYIESFKHKIVIHTKDKEFSFFSSMKILEETLNDNFFFRCSASYIVNLMYVNDVTANEVSVADGVKIPISRAKKKEFMQSLTKYFGGISS